VRHDSLPYCSQMFVYEASNYYFLQLEKVMFITKRESFFDFVYLTARLYVD
jgi:hypothetical protein